MATLNQFQQYSQGENTITNNVLLMLSLLYESNPKYYEEYINALIDENELYQVIPSFNQQVNNNGDGFIDGHITTQQSSIVIETKINSLEWIDKLLKYTKSFRDNEVKILIHLSANKYENNKVYEIKQKLSGSEFSKGIKFYSLTYEDLVSQLKSLHDKYPYLFTLQRLHQQFEDYCQKMGLIHSRHMLRAMACGESFDLNIKHKFYFDQSNRGFSPFNYFGIYQKKSVRYIATLENLIDAEMNDQSELKILKSLSKVTEDQENRLTLALRESISAGWQIGKNHNFFMFNKMVPTDFKKVSPGGIFRVRYFNLEDIFGKKLSDNIDVLAKDLENQTWL